MSSSPTHPAFDEIRRVLGTLPKAEFAVIKGLSNSPTIPRGKHVVGFVREQSEPVSRSADQMTHRFSVLVISGSEAVEAAGDALAIAADKVIGHLVASPTLLWEDATFEPYNDKFWCVSIRVTLVSDFHKPEEDA
ncbi:hypothetical protein [Cellulosimicrobium funkei]|uniref:hypothetical protein n=1 Tax=Cellulosimicrobium funkei TaxID=264251 RepID=UPI0034353B28